MDDQMELLTKVKDMSEEYKRNENVKILQIFHVTMLIIIGLISYKAKDGMLDAFLLLIAFLLTGFAYLFFYLADFYAANCLALSYINEHYKRRENNSPELTGSIKTMEEKLKAKIRNQQICRNMVICLGILAYICIGLSIFISFELYKDSCCILGGVLVLFLVGVLLYKANNLYDDVVNN